MAYSNFGNRSNRRNSGNRRSSRGQFYEPEYEEEYRNSDEEYWEDEEDYEEFARSMDREYGIGEDRRQNRRTGASGRSRNVSADSRSRNASQGRRSDSRGKSVKQPAGRRDGSINARTSGKKPRKKKKGFWGILWRLLVILLLIAAIVAGIFVYKFKDALDVLEMQRVNSVELEDVLRQNMNYQAQNNMILDDYMNIALFGVDSRSGDLLDGDNRSDTIMIASIHKKTGEIRLVSVYRDTVLDVGDGYYTKANTAYALGGPAQAIIMLNRNLDLNILDFVTVGFEGLAHTIDALGGIEIEIDEEERGYLNQYLHDMHLELGTDETPVEKSGKVVVTGIQATAYSRIRYTAGDDFRRAERQRIVLEKTLEKAKNASPTTLVDVANNVIGDMATSLSSREIVNLILMAQKLELKDTGGIPREDARDFTNIEAGSAVMPDTLEDNVVWLHDFLFDNKDYHVSDDVKERNDWIVNNLYPVSYY